MMQTFATGRHRLKPAAVLLTGAVLLFFAVGAGWAGQADAPPEPDTAPPSETEEGLATWTTTIAQILNFLILVFLLKHFLYGPITSAIDNRAKRIAAEQEEARRHREEADAKARAFEEKLEEFERQRTAKVEEVEEEARVLHERLTREARAEADKMKGRWQQAVEQEREQFMRSLRAEIGHQTCAVARQALTELAGYSLETALIDRFLQRLKENPNVWNELREKGGRVALVVRSAFSIPEERRDEIKRAIQTNGTSEAVRFEEDKGLICGIELRSEGNAIGWTLDRYLAQVEEDFDALLRGASERK